MMATLQMTRPKQNQATGTWAALFPPQQETEQQSAQFVKKLLAVAVSNLVYLRALFPERAFGDRSMDGLQLKVLRDDRSCAGAWQVTQWIKACFDAIEKKYLRQLTVLLYVDPADPDTVIETYSFRFSYSQTGGVSMHHGDEIIERVPVNSASSVTSEDTYKATVRMLRTIVVLTQTLRPLPEDVMISMKLLYYDNVTPEDYEPAGFRAAATHQLFFSTEPMNVRVGDVATPHHTLKLRLKTDASQFEPAEEEPDTELPMSEQQALTSASQLPPAPADAADPASVLAASASGGDKSAFAAPSAGGDHRRPQRRLPRARPVPSEDEAASSVGGAAGGAVGISQDTALATAGGEPVAAESVSGRSPALPASTAGGAATPAATQEREPDASEEVRVRCACGVHEDDGLMVRCDLCQNWQHGICFLVLTEEEAPVSHICDSCALESGMPCTDSRLPPLPKPTRMATCLYRRGLCVCEEMARLQPNRLASRLGVEVPVALGLMNRLDKDGILKPTKGKGTVRVVDRDRLFNHAFPRYLNRPGPAQPASQSQRTAREQSEAAAVPVEPDRAAAAAPPQQQQQVDSATGAGGDGPSPHQPKRGRKRSATPKSHPGRPFELAADSEEYAPESVGPRADSKRFKASRADGIAP